VRETKNKPAPLQLSSIRAATCAKNPVRLNFRQRVESGLCIEVESDVVNGTARECLAEIGEVAVHLEVGVQVHVSFRGRFCRSPRAPFAYSGREPGERSYFHNW